MGLNLFLFGPSPATDKLGLSWTPEPWPLFPCDRIRGETFVPEELDPLHRLRYSSL